MINLNNYETWFLLYADNELSAEEQRHVLQFIQKYPELAEEFDALNDMKLLPDESVEYSGKESLKEDQLIETDTGIYFEPDMEIVYPNKQELYRKESAAIIWWLRPLQAAAVLLIGVFWFVNRPADEVKPLADGASHVSVKKDINVDEKSTPVENSTVINVSKSTYTKQHNTAVHAVKVISDPETNVSIPLNKIVEEQAVAQEIIITKPVSNFTEEAVKAAAVRTSVQSEASVTIAEPSLLQAYEEPSKSKKSPLRGLLRKITRTVLNENEENDGRNYVHVASFSIPVSKNK